MTKNYAGKLGLSQVTGGYAAIARMSLVELTRELFVCAKRENKVAKYSASNNDLFIHISQAIPIKINWPHPLNHGLFHSPQ